MAFLHIIDNNDASIRETSAARSDSGRVILCSQSVAEVTAALDRFVAENRRFDRILFETHGGPGRILFGSESLTGEWMRSNWGGRNYGQLSLGWTRIYFNGCNVAAEERGWQFLEATANLFLNRGEVFGHTSIGMVLPIYSWLTGHVVHATGDLRKVTKAAGGPSLTRTERFDL